MKNTETIINFTPIEQLFTQEELSKLIKMINPQPKQCYRNNFLFALLVQSKYPSIEYAEGVYCSFYVHAFNSIVVNGVKHYIDFSGYYLYKRYGIEQAKQAIMLRQFSINEIKTLNDERGFMACSIDMDGTLHRYRNKLCKKYKDVNEVIESRETVRKPRRKSVNVLVGAYA